jgi:hypothetical protein
MSYNRDDLMIQCEELVGMDTSGSLRILYSVCTRYRYAWDSAWIRRGTAAAAERGRATAAAEGRRSDQLGR